MDFSDYYKDIQHDFYRFRDTRVILQEDDKKRPDPLPFSSYTVEIDINSPSFPKETFPRILRHIQKSARDMCLVTLHKTSKFSHVEYELQRTIL